MANHDAVAAVPISGSVSKTLLRNLEVARTAYVLFDTDSLGTINTTDPDTGAITIDVIKLGRVFHYDPTDTTTVDDGTSCLVSNDGHRYKLALGTDVFAYAVLSNTVATPPVSPTLGNSYLVAAGAIGAWAGKSNFVAVFTARGWEFLNFGIGRFIYVEAIDTYYHKNAGGTWVTGLGTQTIGANSVPLSAAINFGKRFIVENQTTTSPPGSPTVGTAYIIGPSATGGWAGLDGKVAICEVAGSFTVYTPTNGWSAYDKSLNNSFTFAGSAWISSVGGFVGSATVFTASGAGASRSGSTFYSYSDTSAPVITTLSGCFDTAFLTYTAKRAGNAGAGDYNLIFDYQARTAIANTSGISEPKDVTAVLFRDSVATGLDWIPLELYSLTSVTQPGLVKVRFEIAAPDALSHVYKIGVLDVNASVTVQSLTRRRFSLTERA